MNDISFVKNIDNLGRIVIPMDIRRKLQISTGDVLSISCNDKNIVLNKYNSLDNGKIFRILNIFVDIFDIKVILVNKDKVVFSNICNINDFISLELKNCIINGITLKYSENEFVIGRNKVSGIYNMLPIITKDGIIGSVILLGEQNENTFDLCSLINKLIMLELNIS